MDGLAVSKVTNQEEEPPLFQKTAIKKLATLFKNIYRRISIMRYVIHTLKKLTVAIIQYVITLVRGVIYKNCNIYYSFPQIEASHVNSIGSNSM